MISALWLLLAVAWAFIVDKIEDRLPATVLGFITLWALCLLNPFLWLFLRSLMR